MNGLFEVSALDVVIFFLFIYVVYKLFFKKADVVEVPQTSESSVEPLGKCDMTIEELKKYNGVDDPHICPEGAYGALAGKDATRALGSMDVKQARDVYDDYVGIPEDELQDATDWAERLTVKYPVVGRLLPSDKK